MLAASLSPSAQMSCEQAGASGGPTTIGGSIDLPAIGTRALPGKREEAYRAGITPRILCGTIEDSTGGKGESRLGIEPEVGVDETWT